MEKLIAYCGVDCAECGAYLAFKNDDWALREQTAAEWNEAHKASYTPEMINCTSCKSSGVQLEHCAGCEIRSCAKQKEVITCEECGELASCKIMAGFGDRCVGE
ncbi:MAG: DUF3795 domain-containing protein [Spirochaetaceae bacterium]|nr:DUF3795 domain-containing protein [Spirochaetaceae bacterium]